MKPQKRNRRKQKRTGRILYGKLFAFIFIMSIFLFLSAMAAYRGIQYISYNFYSENVPKPIYYLLVGTDNQFTAQADSIIVASIDSNSKKINLISIPGNTKIGKDEKDHMILKTAFSEGNLEKMQNAVENLLHIRINKYAVFDYDSFRNLMEKTGNIEIYVERPMSHDNESGISDIWLHQGYQSLDAEKSLSYIRYIDDIDGEIGRIQREERFIKTKIVQLQKNFSFINWLYAKYYWKAAETDISSSDAAAIAYDLTDTPLEDIHFIILPGEMHKAENQDMWVSNPVEIQKVIGLTIGENNE